jgi:hypothetical protein
MVVANQHPSTVRTIDDRWLRAGIPVAQAIGHRGLLIRALSESWGDRLIAFFAAAKQVRASRPARSGEPVGRLLNRRQPRGAKRQTVFPVVLDTHSCPSRRKGRQECRPCAHPKPKGTSRCLAVRRNVVDDHKLGSGGRNDTRGVFDLRPLRIACCSPDSWKSNRTMFSVQRPR